MARIRTIKPELLEDEKTARLSNTDWRLFVSLILLADDYGNMRGNPELLWGQSMWGSETSRDEVAAALVRLEELDLVSTYSVRGQSYLSVVGWAKHQKIDKPGKPHVPGPDDPEKAEERVWSTYFVRLGDDGPIKIGKSIDVPARIAKLQTSAPSPLNVLKVVTRNIETECHRRFHHLRSHGEWFAPAEELLAFISAEPVANHSRIVPVGLAPDRDRDRDRDPDREGTTTGKGQGATPPSDPAGVWTAHDWRSAYGRTWVVTKNNGVGTLGGGEEAARATGDLTDQLAALPVSERLAAQAKSGEMFAEYMADGSPGLAKARWPWKWFVSRFDSLRFPKPVVVAQPARESFETIRARESAERAARSRASSERAIAQTAETHTTCAEHLYGKREDRKCNPKCPRWEGGIASDPIRHLAESKAVAHG